MRLSVFAANTGTLITSSANAATIILDKLFNIFMPCSPFLISFYLYSFSHKTNISCLMNYGTIGCNTTLRLTVEVNCGLLDRSVCVV